MMMIFTKPNWEAGKYCNVSYRELITFIVIHKAQINDLENYQFLQIDKRAEDNDKGKEYVSKSPKSTKQCSVSLIY